MAFEDSLWHHTAGDSFAPRPPLPGDVDADVAIVGAGYTGLWTAYYLHELDPKLRVVIVERHRSRSWEPEPLRWLGVNGGRLLLAGADRAEARSGKPARSAKAFARFIGY